MGYDPHMVILFSCPGLHLDNCSQFMKHLLVNITKYNFIRNNRCIAPRISSFPSLACSRRTHSFQKWLDVAETTVLAPEIQYPGFSSLAPGRFE